MFRNRDTGMTFQDGDTRPAGHIFYIPKQDRPGADHDDRKFYLLERCDESHRIATLAAMSTKDNEKKLGATLYPIQNPRARLRKPDQRGSFVCTYLLMNRNVHLLDESVDGETNHVGRVRERLKTSLGIGTQLPTATEHTSSIRGRLVRVTDEVKSVVFFRYGFVLTEHAYSPSRSWQIVVPIVHAPSLEPDENNLRPVNDSQWRAGLPNSWGDVLLMTQRVVSISQGEGPDGRGLRDLPREIDAVLPYTIDAGSLSAVEAALTRRLSLP